MAKITIDEVEYDTDTFNESQLSAYSEINLASDLKKRYEYHVDLLNARIVSLAKFIADSNG